LKNNYQKERKGRKQQQQQQLTHEDMDMETEDDRHIDT
jgi:hypothetical protein